MAKLQAGNLPLQVQRPGDVPTPPLRQYYFFVNQQDGKVWYKDSLGVSRPVGGGTTIESGTFTLRANGLTASINGVPAVENVNFFTPGANAILRISTIKKLKLGFFKVKSDDNKSKSIDGISDGINQSCEDSVNNILNFTNCIYVSYGSRGWTGQVLLADITDTYYDIRFTQVGMGLNITGQWHGNME